MNVEERADKTLPPEFSTKFRPTFVIRLVYMIFWLAIRDGVRITLSRERPGEGLPKLMLGENEAVPPPRHRFEDIVEVFRKFGAHAAQDPQSPFHVSLLEYEREQLIIVKIDQPGYDVFLAANAILQKVYDLQEKESRERWEQLNQAGKTGLLQGFGLGLAAGICLLIGACLLWYFS